MKSAHPFLLGGLLLALSACSDNVLLDNPSPSSVTFTIDGEKTVLEPQSTAGISLDEGKHQIHIEGSGIPTRDTAINLREGGIIHAGSSTYLLWRQLYGIQKDRATLLNERWVEFDSAKAFGDFKIFPPSVVFLEKTWDHGLEEPLPESKTLMISKDFAVESKIFRAKDFLEAYKNLQEKAQ